MTMIRYFIFSIFYCAIASQVFAQPPHIDSMIVTGNREIVLYGDVGPSPKIFIDSIPIPVTKSDTNYCMCTIPDTGKGSEGYVYIEARGYQSNSKLLTKWDLTVKYGVGCNYNEHYVWRYDLYSFLQGPKNANQLDMQGVILALSPVQFGPGYLYYYFSVGDVPISLYLNENFGIDGGGTEGRKPCDITYDGVAKFLPPLSACDLVIRPSLLLPAYLSTQTGDSIRFIWNKGLSIKKYHLQVATNYLYSPNTSVLVDTIITDSTFLWPFTKSFAQYFWRVQGINNEGTTAWAGTWIFSPDVVNASVSERQFLGSNFWLSYDISSTSLQVNSFQTVNSLSIYDVLGREMQSLHLPNSSVSNGINRYKISILDLPKGSYFLRAISGSNLYSGYFYR
jgi:hypothetical protein